MSNKKFIARKGLSVLKDTNNDNILNISGENGDIFKINDAGNLPVFELNKRNGDPIITISDNSNVSFSTVGNSTGDIATLNSNGVLSKRTVAQILTDINAVPTSRTLTAGDGLTGGGNLTANRTFAVDATVVRTTGNQTIGGTKTFSSNIIGNLDGNAGTATALQTARTINGTSFNGTANITTANWGTARTITIGSTGKSVNGSGNVSWSLAEIGAQAALGFTPVNRAGDTMTGFLTLNADPTSGLHAATKQYVDGILASNDAMIFKGTLGTGGTVTALPTTHGIGWTFKVITAGTYAGQVAEIGDMYISLVNRTGSGNQNSDWAVIQANIDGAVTGPSSSTNNHVVLFDGTSGKTIKSAGVTLGQGVLTVNTSGSGISGSGTFSANATGNNTITITSNATSANTANTIVLRDASGNFTAGTITAALTGNASTATTWQTARTLTIGSTGKSVNGSANVSWSLSEIGAAASSITISAGNGLTGGGNLTANRTITLGTPSSITLASTNSVTTDSHTHEFAPGGTTAQYLRGDGSLATFPTIGNGTLTLATSGIATGSATFTANQTGGTTFTVTVPGTNIAEGTRTATTVPITSSTGNNATLSAATTSLAGVMSSADKTKLDGIAANANNYVHPTGFTNQPTSALTNAAVISQITVTNEGHVSGVTTRNLTAANIGAAASSITLTAGDGLTGGGNLTANRTFAVDSTVVRTTGAQNIAGVKKFTDNVIIGSSTLNYQENLSVNIGTSVVATVPTTSGNAVFFDYVVMKGGNFRSGTVYAVFSSTEVTFTEVSTEDIGDTFEIELSVSILTGNVRLTATAASNSWEVKTLVRVI